MRCPEFHGRVRAPTVLGETACRRTLSIAKTIPDALWVTISTERGAGIESLENKSPNARVLLLP